MGSHVRVQRMDGEGGGGAMETRLSMLLMVVGGGEGRGVKPFPNDPQDSVARGTSGIATRNGRRASW